MIEKARVADSLAHSLIERIELSALQARLSRSSPSTSESSLSSQAVAIARETAQRGTGRA